MAESSPRRKLVEAEIYEQAANLFATRGFEGTTMQDVAETLGLSRASLYHYIKSKDDLLQRLVADLTVSSAQVLSDLKASTTLSPVEKLREATRRMVVWATEHPARLRLLEHVEQELPPPAARLHRDAKRKVFDELREIILAGIKSGAFRPVDERVAAFYVIGACNWVAWWYQPGGQHASPDEIADEIADMTVRGISADRDSGAPVGLQGVASRLREDVALLDRIITSH